MGKKNVITKKYISNNETFADIFNYYIYNGKKIIQPQQLEQKDVTELMAVLSKDDSVHTREKLRDVLKECIIKQADGCMYVLLGAESQSDIHYAMPVRNGLYDFLDYASQVEDIAKEHRKNRDLKGAEFLSGFAKYDKIKPVITLVVYFGAEEWDGPRSLHEMFDVKDENILQYIPDYKINLLLPKEVEHPERFSTDMKYIISFLQASDDEDRIKKFLEDNKEELSELPEDTVMLLRECSEAEFEMEETEGKVNMCKGLQDWARSERLSANQEDIMELLKDLGDVPEEVENTIRSQTDVDILKRWLKLAARASTIEDFSEQI